MSKGNCINCTTPLNVLDDDPNGDPNCVCAKCRAEENHDFDAEPNAVYDRRGHRVETPQSKNGFTAIEFMIVLSILMILGAAIMPVFLATKKMSNAPVISQPIVFEVGEPEEPEKPVLDDTEVLKPGEYLYYVTYSFDQGGIGASNVKMTSQVTNWNSIYGEDGLVPSIRKHFVERNKYEMKSIIVTSFQLLDKR